MIYFWLPTTEIEPLWSFWTCRPRSILLIMKSSLIVSTGTVASLAKRSVGLLPIYAAELRWSRLTRPRPKKSTFVSEFPRAQSLVGLFLPSISANLHQWQLRRVSPSMVSRMTLRLESGYSSLKIPLRHPSSPPVSLFSPNGASSASVLPRKPSKTKNRQDGLLLRCAKKQTSPPPRYSTNSWSFGNFFHIQVPQPWSPIWLWANNEALSQKCGKSSLLPPQAHCPYSSFPRPVSGKGPRLRFRNVAPRLMQLLTCRPTRENQHMRRLKMPPTGSFCAETGAKAPAHSSKNENGYPSSIA